MTIKGNSIIFITAKIHYKFGADGSVLSTVDLLLNVDGIEHKIETECKDETDLRAKFQDFKNGITVKELTI